jgi:VWFA-related protein
MTRLLRIVMCVSAASLSLFAQQVPPTFRSGVERVRFDVLAHNGGRPLGRLTADDFEVLDNGRPVSGLELTRNDDAIAVAVLLDISRSIAVDAMDEMVGATRELVDALEPRDTAWLLTFAEHIALRAGPVSQRDPLKAVLGNLRPGGGTTMWDALFGAVGLVQARSGRALVLVFSDGDDTTSWLDEPRALGVLRRADVVVSAIRPRHMADGFMPLERAAISTGGVVLKTESGAKLDTQFVALLNEFRQGYVLSYSPEGLVADNNGWHEVGIRLKTGRGKVRARPGYFEPGR